jgi:hypothetical protein
MYPMDNINDLIFNFTETDSINDNIERLGLEGTNFVVLTGSLFINMLILITSVYGMKLLSKICVYFYKYKVARYIGLNIRIETEVFDGL